MPDFTLTANTTPPSCSLVMQIGKPPAGNDEILRDTTLLRASVGALLLSVGEVLDGIEAANQTVGDHYEEWVEWTSSVGEETEPEP